MAEESEQLMRHRVKTMSDAELTLYLIKDATAGCESTQTYSRDQRGKNKGIKWHRMLTRLVRAELESRKSRPVAQ